MRKLYKFESNEVSDKEIIENLPDEKIQEIEELIKKATKKDIDLEEISKEESTDSESEKSNEAAGVMGTLFLISLVPLILEAGGNIINLVNKKLGVSFSKEQWKQYKALLKIKSAYKQLIKNGSAKLSYDGKTTEVTWKDWTKLGERATEIMKSLGYNYFDLNWKSALVKKMSKNESKISLRYIKTFESFKIYEGGGHTGIKLKTFDSDWKPSFTKEGDTEFIKNEINRIDDEISTNLPIGTMLGDGLVNAGHKLHSAYTYPIRLFLKGIAFVTKWEKMQKKKNREIAANLIYATVMVVWAGWGIYDKMSHFKGIASAKDILLKVWKESKSTEDAIKSLIELNPGGIFK